MQDFILELPKWLDAQTCEEIITQFEADPRKAPGVMGAGAATRVDEKYKLSTDLPISGLPEWKLIDDLLYASLQGGIAEYRKHFPVLSQFNLQDRGYQIQRTKPGGFYDWHSDNDNLLNAHRMYVFIWYLNDVQVGGQTELQYVGRSIQPEQGKLLLFPACWTHYHRGAKVISNTKYIVTGWVCLFDPQT